MLGRTIKKIVTSALLVIVIAFAFTLNAAAPVQNADTPVDLMVTFFSGIFGVDMIDSEQELPSDGLMMSTAASSNRWRFSDEDFFNVENALPISNGDDMLIALKGETNITLTDDVALSDYGIIEDDLTIHANGHTIYSSINRAFLAEANKITVTINDAVIDMDEGSADRILQISSGYRNVKLILNNCRINLADSGATYGINIAKDTSSCSVELNDCEITAYTGVYIHGEEHDISVNNCTFNMNAVFGGEGGVGIIIGNDAVANITVSNTTFNASDKHSIAIASEGALSWENSVTIDNCTFNGDPVKDIKTLDR